MGGGVASRLPATFSVSLQPVLNLCPSNITGFYENIPVVLSISATSFSGSMQFAWVFYQRLARLHKIEDAPF